MPKENGMVFADAAYNFHRASQEEKNCKEGDCGCEGPGRYRLCCDPDGCCCYYPAGDRDPFWPDFAHPRWLTCRDLYRGGEEDYECGEEEE